MNGTGTGILSMTWNGTDITGLPTLIYHDELITSTGPITYPYGPGRLVCRLDNEEATQVQWFHANGNRVTTQTNGNFIQTRSSGPPIISRLSMNIPISSPRTDSLTNGLWFCRANNKTLYVGLYSRIPGEFTN